MNSYDKRQLLEKATSGIDILDTMKADGQGSSDTLDLMNINFNAENAFDFDSAVLPDTDACRKIEAQAIKDAQAEFKKRPKIYQ